MGAWRRGFASGTGSSGSSVTLMTELQAHAREFSFSQQFAGFGEETIATKKKSNSSLPASGSGPDPTFPPLISHQGALRYCKQRLSGSRSPQESAAHPRREAVAQVERSTAQLPHAAQTAEGKAQAGTAGRQELGSNSSAQTEQTSRSKPARLRLSPRNGSDPGRRRKGPRGAGKGCGHRRASACLRLLRSSSSSSHCLALCTNTQAGLAPGRGRVQRPGRWGGIYQGLQEEVVLGQHSRGKKTRVEPHT